jgi:hypothetical protein
MFPKTPVFPGSGQRSCPDAHSRLFQLKESPSPNSQTGKTARAEGPQKYWRICGDFRRDLCSKAGIQEKVFLVARHTERSLSKDESWRRRSASEWADWLRYATCRLSWLSSGCEACPPRVLNLTLQKEASALSPFPIA